MSGNMPLEPLPRILDDHLTPVLTDLALTYLGPKEFNKLDKQARDSGAPDFKSSFERFLLMTRNDEEILTATVQIHDEAFIGAENKEASFLKSGYLKMFDPILERNWEPARQVAFNLIAHCSSVRQIWSKFEPYEQFIAQNPQLVGIKFPAFYKPTFWQRFLTGLTWIVTLLSSVLFYGLAIAFLNISLGEVASLTMLGILSGFIIALLVGVWSLLGLMDFFDDGDLYQSAIQTLTEAITVIRTNRQTLNDFSVAHNRATINKFVKYFKDRVLLFTRKSFSISISQEHILLLLRNYNVLIYLRVNEDIQFWQNTIYMINENLIVFMKSCGGAVPREVIHLINQYKNSCLSLLLDHYGRQPHNEGLMMQIYRTISQFAMVSHYLEFSRENFGKLLSYYNSLPTPKEKLELIKLIEENVKMNLLLSTMVHRQCNLYFQDCVIVLINNYFELDGMEGGQDINIKSIEQSIQRLEDHDLNVPLSTHDLINKYRASCKEKAIPPEISLSLQSATGLSYR